MLSFSLSSSLSFSLSLNEAFLVCRQLTCLVKLKPVINGSLLCQLMDCLTRRLNCLPSCLHLKRKFKQEEGLHGPDSRLLPHLSTSLPSNSKNIHDLQRSISLSLILGGCLPQLTNTSCLCWHKAALSTSVISLKHARAINDDFSSLDYALAIPGKNKAVRVNQHSLSSAPGE